MKFIFETLKDEWGLDKTLYYLAFTTLGSGMGFIAARLTYKEEK